MPNKKPLARLAAGELEMLQMLWNAGSVTILEAQKALGLSIGYTTVQTRLNRLVKKGVVGKTRGRPAKYTAAVSAEQVSAHDLDTLVQRVSQGQVVPLVAHLINRQRLSPGEVERLKQMIAQAERRSQSSRGQREGE